jgi:hypothetical protein
MVNQKGPNIATGFKKSVIACAILGAATQAQAVSWELDNGVRIDLDTQLAYSAQWRVEQQDSNLLDLAKNGLLAINSDDGNRSFNDGDITQNRISIASDLDINYQGDSFTTGVFIRARGFYDDVYSGASANQSAATCNNNLVSVSGDVAIAPLPGLDQINIIAASGDCSNFDNNQGIEDYHKSRVEFLDAFFYSTFDVSDKTVSLRIGDQVVSWGESLALYGGISSAQGPLDVSKSNVPGVELKDIFMPVGQVYVETDLTEAFSLGAYYQYDWDRSRIDSPGSYMSPVDIIGEGVQSLIIPTALANFDAPIVRDEPDAGQWGITLRYLAQELNSTEFGFYYINYNDTLPSFQLGAAVVPAATMAIITGNPAATAMAVPNGLLLEYFEDIDLFGVSFGTVVGDTNVSGEISYRDGQPVQINAGALGGGFHFAPAQTIQAQVSVLHILQTNDFADAMTFVGEIGYNRVLGIDATATTNALAIDVNNVRAALDNDRWAAGYLIKLSADYYNISSALDLKVSVTLKHDFKGTSAVSFTFTEDKIDLGIGADFTYLSAHRFGLKYVAFLTDTDSILDDGDPLEFGHQLADRDNVSIYYKYSF